MKLLLNAAVVTALVLTAGAASAATRQIDFSFGPLSNASDIAPFGLMIGDTVSGSFTFDDSGFAGAGTYDLQPIMQSLSFETGTKSWELGDVTLNTDEITVNGANQITRWSFRLDDGDDVVNIFTNNTILVATSNSSSIFCNGCSSFEEVAVAAPVPLPASVGFLIAGFAGFGVVGMRRRKRA